VQGGSNKAWAGPHQCEVVSTKRRAEAREERAGLRGLLSGENKKRLDKKKINTGFRHLKKEKGRKATHQITKFYFAFTKGRKKRVVAAGLRNNFPKHYTTEPTGTAPPTSATLVKS